MGRTKKATEGVQLTLPGFEVVPDTKAQVVKAAPLRLVIEGRGTAWFERDGELVGVPTSLTRELRAQAHTIRHAVVSGWFQERDEDRQGEETRQLLGDMGYVALTDINGKTFLGGSDG
jgi:hypothetical protein